MDCAEKEMQGEEHLYERQYQLAMTKLLEVVKENKTDYLPHMYLGICCQNVALEQMAMEHFTHSLMLESKNKYAHAGLGEIEMEKGFNRKAIEHFSNALLLDPKLIRPRIFLSRLLLKHFSQYELAAGHFLKAWESMRELKEFN